MDDYSVYSVEGVQLVLDRHLGGVSVEAIPDQLGDRRLRRASEAAR
jgi:hypothetical protein